MSGVTGGAGESIVYVPSMLAKAGGCHHLIQIVAFRTKSVRANTRVRTASRIQRGIGEQILDGGSRPSSWQWHDLAHFVAAFEYMRILRAVWTVRSAPTELAGVVTVMTIGAQEACAHGTPLHSAVLIPHVLEQTWLRQDATAIMHDGMA